MFLCGKYGDCWLKVEKENIKISDAALFEIERLEKRVYELEKKMKLLETEEHYFNIYSKVVTDERTTIKNKIKEIEKSLEECAKWVLFLTVSVIAILMIELLWQYQIDVVKRNGEKEMRKKFYGDGLLQVINKLIEKNNNRKKQRKMLVLVTTKEDNRATIFMNKEMTRDDAMMFLVSGLCGVLDYEKSDFITAEMIAEYCRKNVLYGLKEMERMKEKRE